MTETRFKGFPEEALTFLSALREHNNREWFSAHRDDFDAHVLGPARAFVTELGERLRDIAPEVVADPRTDRSIFRLHRDTRFSRDKSPYKTHLGVFLWEGEGRKMECPGFYFHLEPDRLMIGGGIYMFARHQLAPYRESVDDPRTGEELAGILAANKRFVPDPPHAGAYKRVPRGFDPDHPRAALLNHKGLTLGEEGPPPAALHSRRILDHCLKRYEKMAPLHRWLLAMTERARS